VLRDRTVCNACSTRNLKTGGETFLYGTPTPVGEKNARFDVTGIATMKMNEHGKLLEQISFETDKKEILKVIAEMKEDEKTNSRSARKRRREEEAQRAAEALRPAGAQRLAEEEVQRAAEAQRSAEEEVQRAVEAQRRAEEEAQRAAEAQRMLEEFHAEVVARLNALMKDKKKDDGLNPIVSPGLPVDTTLIEGDGYPHLLPFSPGLPVDTNELKLTEDDGFGYQLLSLSPGLPVDTNELKLTEDDGFGYQPLSLSPGLSVDTNELKLTEDGVYGCQPSIAIPNFTPGSSSDSFGPSDDQGGGYYINPRSSFWSSPLFSCER